MPASAAALNAIRPLFEDLPALRVRPFLKWAGGKTRLLPALRHSVPPRFKRYFEPFVGGAALFFDLLPTNAVLGDSNPELINCYEVVRDKPNELIRYVLKLRVSEYDFYKLRGLNPDTLFPVERAARLIYLNKTCYNGLYRVNKEGKFNTPYGRHSNVTLIDPEKLMSASAALRNHNHRVGNNNNTVQEYLFIGQ